MNIKSANNLTLIGLSAFIVVFAAGNYWLGFEKWKIHWWADLAWTTASLLTGLKCLRIAKSQQGHYRKAWIFWGAGCLSWFSGMLVWDYRELVEHVVTPFPAVSDLGFMAFAPFFILGMFYYRSEAPAASITLKQICNLGIILSSISITVPVILVESIRTSTGSRLYLAAAVAYPVLYMAAFLFGLICLWLYVWGPNRKVFLLILMGVATHAFTDTLYAYSLLGRTYEAGHYLDVYWIIGFALIYAAAACQEAQDGNRATASIAIVPFPHAKELENFVSTIVLTGVVAVLYGFKDHMHGYMAVYLLPPAVMGISFIGVKEWWSHRLEWKLHNDLIASMADLEQNKARLEGILEITPEAIITVNAAQRIVLFNKGAERIFGYSECEALGQPIDILIPDRFHQAHQKHIVEFAGSAKSASRMDERQEIYGLRKDGAEFPAEASISKINLQGHQFFTVILRDITQRKAAERALSHRVELEKVISSISAHFINLSSDQIHDGIRHGLERIGQFAQADRSYVFLFSENDKKVNNTHEWCAEGIEPQIERLKDVPSEAFPWFIEKISKHAIVHIPRVADLPSDATTEKEEFQRQRIQSLLCVPMVYANTAIGFLGFDSVRKEKTWLDEDINLLKVIGEMFTNMLVRRQAEETLEEQAIRDVLTDLYNRRYFNKRIQEEISLAEQKGHHLAVLICDLDHFKDLNDVLGHQAGDEVLKAIGKRINNAIRGADTAFRWGGDEIVVLLSNTTKEGVLIAAERIREGVIELRNESASTLDISIGVSIYPDHGGTAEELIRLADRALYIAKKGGDKIHIGEEEYQLDEETIKVVFQPVMDVRMKFPVGYEALSRDAQGKLSVLDLFKKYQAIGLLHELKILCFRSQMKIAKAVGIEKVFINVDFKILEKIQPPPIPSGQEVVLEISEAEALHDVENHLEIANQWRKHGYKFAIDDFGAGFISLPFIARLTPDYIKLDRSTVVQALKTPKFKRILSPLLLGLRNCATDGIIAEGIETAKELAVMKDLGIYLVQGYLFGKPEEMK